MFDEIKELVDKKKYKSARELLDQTYERAGAEKDYKYWHNLFLIHAWQEARRKKGEELKLGLMEKDLAKMREAMEKAPSQDAINYNGLYSLDSQILEIFQYLDSGKSSKASRTLVNSAKSFEYQGEEELFEELYRKTDSSSPSPKVAEVLGRIIYGLQNRAASLPQQPQKPQSPRPQQPRAAQPQQQPQGYPQQPPQKPQTTAYAQEQMQSFYQPQKPQQQPQGYPQQPQPQGYPQQQPHKPYQPYSRKEKKPKSSFWTPTSISLICGALVIIAAVLFWVIPSHKDGKYGVEKMGDPGNYFISGDIQGLEFQMNITILPKNIKTEDGEKINVEGEMLAPYECSLYGFCKGKNLTITCYEGEGEWAVELGQFDGKFNGYGDLNFYNGTLWVQGDAVPFSLSVTPNM